MGKKGEEGRRKGRAAGFANRLPGPVPFPRPLAEQPLPGRERLQEAPTSPAKPASRLSQQETRHMAKNVKRLSLAPFLSLSAFSPLQTPIRSPSPEAPHLRTRQVMYDRAAAPSICEREEASRKAPPLCHTRPFSRPLRSLLRSLLHPSAPSLSIAEEAQRIAPTCTYCWKCCTT